MRIVFIKSDEPFSSPMAKPINETPVLKGKDAEQFVKNMKASEAIRVSAKERASIKADF